MKSQFIDHLARVVTMLVLAKERLYPDSFIQARGVLGAPGLFWAEKKLLWFQPGFNDAERREAISEGMKTIRDWFDELIRQNISEATLLVAGDNNFGTGAMVDPNLQSHWRIEITIAGGEVGAKYHNVPRYLLQKADKL